MAIDPVIACNVEPAFEPKHILIAELIILPGEVGI